MQKMFMYLKKDKQMEKKTKSKKKPDSEGAGFFTIAFDSQQERKKNVLKTLYFSKWVFDSRGFLPSTSFLKLAKLFDYNCIQNITNQYYGMGVWIHSNFAPIYRLCQLGIFLI